MMLGRESKKIFFITVICGVLGGMFFASADDGLPSIPVETPTPTETYSGGTLPSRDQYSTSMPTMPSLPSMDPEVSRQQGSQTLQSVDLDEASDRQNVRSQLGGMSGESSNPNGADTSSFGGFSPPSGITTTQAGGGSTGASGSQRSASRADPLGGNASSGDEAQSTVSRDGTFPAGSLDATSGEPVGLGTLVVDRFSRDVVASWYNSLAAMTALRTQIVNRQTQRIADKIDEVNDTHRSLNQNLTNLISTMNQVLMQLPTIPGA